MAILCGDNKRSEPAQLIKPSGSRTVFKKLFGNTRLFQALSHAYDQYARMQSMQLAPDRFKHIGNNTVIQPRVQITYPSRVWLGNWTTIQNETFINSIGGLHVGDYVGIAYRSTILTFNHAYRNAEAIPFDNRIFLQPVIIRDFAWIGFNSCIMPGIEIGEGAIISMGSVVTKNVPPMAIVMGNPATVIGHRSQEHFDKCKAEAKTTPHRILEIYGRFEEIIPLMTKKRYAKELQELGMLPLPQTPQQNEG